MSAEPKQSNYISFSCRTSMAYGQPISILGKPQLTGAMWTARAFSSRSGMTEIFLTDPDIPDDVFLVLSCQSSAERLYSCRAVLAKELERESDRIEEDIVNLLHK